MGLKKQLVIKHVEEEKQFITYWEFVLYFTPLKHGI